MPNQNNNEESEIFPNWQRVIRENLEWYRDGEKDHGDLVIAEESIITEVKNEIFKAEQRGKREGLEEARRIMTRVGVPYGKSSLKLINKIINQLK